MKLIPTYVHGILDYIGGALLIFSPEIFGFSGLGGAAVGVVRILGVVIIVQASLSDYEFGGLRVLPMTTHLMNDYMISVFLAASPWIFGFYAAPLHVWIPHTTIGITVFLLTLLTEPTPRGVKFMHLHYH